MELRVKEAIDVFLDALNKGTLAKGSCKACAVGNLVAHGLGGTIKRVEKGYFTCDKPNDEWRHLFITGMGCQRKRINLLSDKRIVKNIKATSFTWQELAKIEYAFETNAKIDASDYDFFKDKEILEDQIKGLEAVVKVMLSFSQDEETDVKEVFTKKAELC